MTYIAQLSDGSNTQFFPRTRWDALLNVPSLVQPSALKVTKWNKVITAKNGSEITDSNNLTRLDFVNFSILTVDAWIKLPNLEAWKYIEAASIPAAVLNGYSKKQAITQGRFYSDAVEADLNITMNGALTFYPRKKISAGTGFPYLMSYILYN